MLWKPLALGCNMHYANYEPLECDMQRLPLVIVVRANWDAQCGWASRAWWKLVPTLGPNQLIASAIPVVIFFGVSGCVSLSAHAAGSLMCSFGLFVCL